LIHATHAAVLHDQRVGHMVAFVVQLDDEVTALTTARASGDILKGVRSNADSTSAALRPDDEL